MKPNTFLIGVQKSATTSVYDWISQHPEICAPNSIKDIPLFSDKRLFDEKEKIFKEVYGKYYFDQKVICHGNVNYIYFEESLERIKDYANVPKFILVLRNPIQRAISAYNFAVKRGLELNSIQEAFNKEKDIIRNGSFQERSDLTYKSHGLYYKQIKCFLKYFKPEQLQIILFDDLKLDPNNEIKKIFDFLEVDNSFLPKLNYKNETGVSRNSKISKFIYKESKIKSIIMNSIVNKLFSFDFKVKAKHFIGKLMTKKGENVQTEIPILLKEDLIDFYKEDIKQLERYLERNLNHWLV